MNELIPASGSIEQLTAGRDTLAPAVEFFRVSPLDWFRQRRLDREARRADREKYKAEAAHQRLVDRLGTLVEGWQILDFRALAGVDREGLLAIGPGGVYAVTVKNHGRSRINFAGDVVQVDGRRPRYVAEARSNAQFVTDALSRRAGVKIPVMAVLAFAGTGAIAFHGLPKGCIVTSYQDLHRVLDARGRRLATTTVEKVCTLAHQPETWLNESYVALADRYRWYSDTEGVGADKQADPR